MNEAWMGVDYRSEYPVHKVGGITTIIVDSYSVDSSVMDHRRVSVDLEWVAVLRGVSTMGSPPEVNQHRSASPDLLISFPELGEAKEAFLDYYLAVLGVGDTCAVGVSSEGLLKS